MTNYKQHPLFHMKDKKHLNQTEFKTEQSYEF